MDLRLGLYELSARYGLDSAAAARLAHFAGLDRVPGNLARRVVFGVAVLAAALGGFGVILWLAANWDSLGRFARFALLESTIVVMAVGAFLRPAWRAPMGLVALLCIGGLFAYFGQTYQTGADPWQLFALWALLTLPLCLSVRSDVAWTPWILVAIVAIGLWQRSNWIGRMMGAGMMTDGVMTEDFRWTTTAIQVVVWLFALGLSLALSPMLKRWTGAGAWAWRVGLVWAVGSITVTSITERFFLDMPNMTPAIVVLAALALVFSSKRFFDVFALSAAALGLNVLLVVKLYLSISDLGGGSFTTAVLFSVGIGAAVLLGVTVSLILRCQRRHSAVLKEQV